MQVHAVCVTHMNSTPPAVRCAGNDDAQNPVRWVRIVECLFAIELTV